MGLDMVKENWKQYENNIAQEDFKLFSTHDDALQDKNHWLSISTNSNGYGFPRSSGPDGNVYDQWNAWGEPVLKNKRKKAYETDRQTDRQRETETETDRRTYRDRQTDRQADRETDRE